MSSIILYYILDLAPMTILFVSIGMSNIYVWLYNYIHVLYIYAVPFEDDYTAHIDKALRWPARSVHFLLRTILSTHTHIFGVWAPSPIHCSQSISQNTNDTNINALETRIIESCVRVDRHHVVRGSCWLQCKMNYLHTYTAVLSI